MDTMSGYKNIQEKHTVVSQKQKGVEVFITQNLWANSAALEEYCSFTSTAMHLEQRMLPPRQCLLQGRP